MAYTTCKYDKEKDIQNAWKYLQDKNDYKKSFTCTRLE